MSAVKEARQGAAPAPSKGAWRRPLLRATLLTIVALLGLAVVGAAGLAWRLSQGPVTVTHLVAWAINRSLPAGAARVHVGFASLQWRGFGEGAGRGLDMVLSDVAAGPDESARLAHGELSLSLLRLLQGQFVPRTLALDGLRLRAARQPDGSVSLEMGDLAGGGGAPGPSTADVTTALRQPAGTDRNPAIDRLQSLAQLQSVSLRHVDVSVDDQALQTRWQLTVASLDLQRQPGGGVKGTAQGAIGAGRATAQVALTADLAPDGGTHLAVSLAPLQLAQVTQGSTAAEPVIDTALTGNAAVELTPGLRPRQASATLSAGAGSMLVGGARVAFDHLAASVAASWPDGSLRPQSVRLEQAVVAFKPSKDAAPTTVSVSGTAERNGPAYQAAVEVKLDRVAFADLGSVWPASVGRNVRPWLVENVTAGTAHDGDVRLSLSAPIDDPGGVTLTDAQGTLLGDDVTINWLRPVPPIEHAQAVVTARGPAVIEVAVPSGQQGKLTLKDGLVRFTGLTASEQVATITLRLSGAATEVMQLLTNPRLHLFDKRPPAAKPSAGTVAAQLSVTLPLRKAVTGDELQIASKGHLAALVLPRLVGQFDLTRGELDFAVTQDGFKAGGTATLAGVSGQVDASVDFRSGPPDQELVRASMSGTATAAQMRAVKIDLLTSGQAQVSASYVTRRSERGSATVTLGLADAGISALGWSKPPGPAANAHATIALDHDRISGISAIGASGPDLKIQAHADMDGTAPRVLYLETLELGPTRASGRIGFPAREGQAYTVQLAGPELDLSGQIDRFGASSSSTRRDAPFHVELQFGLVRLGDGRSLRGLSARADDDGARLTDLDVSSTGPERLQATIERRPGGRRLTVRAQDGGALLAALGVTETVHGGRLVVDGEFDDRLAWSPLSGTAELDEFSVQDGVTVGKVLQAITIYGIADAVRSDGLLFARLQLPFRYDRRQLHIGEARAYSASLGLTGTGWIDFARKIMDVRGTIVPAYAINSALGRLPLVGRVFSPERGGGLLAVNYVVNGGLADPRISVNPLSALTPGFLRGLFNVFR